MGGRTYFFGFFEGFRYPQSETIERAVPSASMEAGISDPLPAAWKPYNMKTLDPRGIGINPDVSADVEEVHAGGEPM